ncbi:hypothetical protein OPT61_g1371 [Boeremia exigua]|uniref:Uncharacterized protein n=1 Tax=Boeremia exigua TaxID=749465 RepID=A0ACC2IQJ1_9PLEO|nr:hypothetical protein OPT61_g1371 [Boeremia exigua]
MSWSCYNTVGRNGTWDGEVHVPCNMTAVEAGGHSTCCRIGDLCLTNGLCMHKEDVDKKNWYWRTGCTDESWEDPACPKWCDKIEPNRNTGLVMNCLKEESWCCAYVGGSLRDWPKQDPINTTCCTVDDLVTRAADPVVYATATIPIKVSIQSTSTSQTSVSLSTMSLPSTVTTADQSSLPTTDSPTQQNSDSAGLATGAKIGLGVGIPVGVIGIAAIGALFWLRRKRSAGAKMNTPELFTPSANDKAAVPPYQETAMNQQGAAMYRHEAPSPQIAHELPAAVEPSELPHQTKFK